MFLVQTNKHFYWLEDGVYYDLWNDFKKYDTFTWRDCNRNKIPENISYELDTLSRKHNDILEMSWKVVKVEYIKEHWFFLSYQWKDWLVFIDPTFMA